MPRPAPEFLCIGLANLDLAVRLDEFPAENSKCEVRELLTSGGGPAANAAWLLSSWGARCAFAGVIGDDLHGAQIHREFEAAGTDLSLLEVRPNHATPVSLVWVSGRTGSRTIVNRRVPGQPCRLDPAALDALAPRFLLFDGHEAPAARQALERWPEARTMLDAGSWRDGTAELAGRVKILAASERFAIEAARRAGRRGDDLAPLRLLQFLRETWRTTTVITLGERGLVAAEDDKVIELPAFPAEVRDTTAAGDIFHGALAFALHRGDAFRTSLRFASMAASLSVRRDGGRSSTPTLAAVEEALTHAD